VSINPFPADSDQWPFSISDEERRGAESTKRSYRIAAEGLGAAILGNILEGPLFGYPHSPPERAVANRGRR
jgi:hypothetical protein